VTWLSSKGKTAPLCGHTWVDPLIFMTWMFLIL